MSEFSMNEVTEALHALGHPAYTEQTGGGCATIYAGPRWDEPGWGSRYAAIAGPGWFANYRWTDPRGDTDDFYVGADDDGVTDATSAKDMTVAEIVELIVAAIARAAEYAPSLHGYTEVWQDWQKIG